MNYAPAGIMTGHVFPGRALLYRHPVRYRTILVPGNRTRLKNKSSWQLSGERESRRNDVAKGTGARYFSDDDEFKWFFCFSQPCSTNNDPAKRVFFLSRAYTASKSGVCLPKPRPLPHSKFFCFLFIPSLSLPLLPSLSSTHPHFSLLPDSQAEPKLVVLVDVIDLGGEHEGESRVETLFQEG